MALAALRNYEDQEGHTAGGRSPGSTAARVKRTTGSRQSVKPGISAARRQDRHANLTLLPAAAPAVAPKRRVRRMVPFDVLSLPQFSVEVPTLLHVTTRKGAESNQVQLAEALLDAGVMRGVQWKGSLSQTIEAGLDRWINENQGVKTLSPAMEFSFVFTDDVRTWHLEDECWLREFKRPQDNLAGAFAIQMEADPFHIRWFDVREKVLELEKLVPGAGYAVMALIDRALAATIGAATPAWAYNEFDCTDYWDEVAAEFESTAKEEYPDMREREAVRHDLISRENFLARCPAEACGTAYDAGLFRRAHRGLAGKRRTPIVRAALDMMPLAAELHKRLTEFKDLPNFSDDLWTLQNDSSWEALMPLGIRWGEDDMTQRLCDDRHHDLVNGGTASLLVYTQGFDLTQKKGAPGSVAVALKNIGKAVQILCVVDRLLMLLAKGVQ